MVVTVSHGPGPYLMIIKLCIIFLSKNALSYPNCIARSLIHLFDCFHFRFDIMFGLSAGAGVSVGAGAGP